MAKKQEALQEEETGPAPSTSANGHGTGSGDNATDPITVNGESPVVPSDEGSEPQTVEPTTPTVPKKEKVVRKALLKNDDVELSRVQAVSIPS